MNRYSMVLDNGWPNITILKEVKNDFGEWVPYKEAAAEIESLKKVIDELKERVKALEEWEMVL